MTLSPADFPSFFSELHSSQDRTVHPFPWQIQLAGEVCSGRWPAVIDLPTASGKTACIDIALFALAVSPSAARRIFFVVDRRVIVNEAFLRVKSIAAKLSAAQSGVLRAVADKLRDLAGGARDPLAFVELRGGIYRDDAWVRSPLQPTVVLSTVDQVGSRLLFRGYGVSNNAWPIHAGLLANDALFLLDEAHCSRAFAQTLQAIERYRSPEWAEQPLGFPFQFVELTATPAREGNFHRFTIGDADRTPGNLGPRVFAPKPARLVQAKARPKDLPKIAAALVEQLDLLIPKAGTEEAGTEVAGPIRSAAVIVNRVATARLVYHLLAARGLDVSLVIGRMRPIDRDDLLLRLQPLKSGTPRIPGEAPRFVVATQCLEVGADLDFDLLVSEAAAIDALLQRFGRLDRLGRFGQARAAIVAPQIDEKRPDPIYGEALLHTWRWLSSIAVSGSVNMAIAAEGDSSVSQLLARLDPQTAAGMRTPAKVAPFLFPAHLDTLVQTSPSPSPQPDPAVFLHGPDSSPPDVQVIWRADLDSADPEFWAEIVSFLPPVSAEAMSVPIGEFRRWCANSPTYHETSDLEGIPAVEDTKNTPGENGDRTVLLWRGAESRTLPAREVPPGATVIFPVSYAAWDDLGHKPPGFPEDRAEEAALTARRRIDIRLHPSVHNAAALAGLLSQSEPDREAVKPEPDREAVIQYLLDSPQLLAHLAPEAVSRLQAHRRARPLFDLLPYPAKSDLAPPGYLLLSRGRLDPGLLSEDAGHDEPSAGQKITLEAHTRDVAKAVATNVSRLLDPTLLEPFQHAAYWHDSGKVDLRFQALLHGGDPMAARFSPAPLAKGGSSARNLRERCELPTGFRHELLSFLFARKALPPETVDRDLVLHLIASHHGRCRPFAPVIQDPAPLSATCFGHSISAADRIALAAHHLDAGVAERFWSLNRRYGWWGLAFLEAIFRLGDWYASEHPNFSEEPQ